MELCQIDWNVSAAWVQAIGSLVAIGIAIWVPFKLHEESRKELLTNKKAHARIVQASLLPELYRLRSTTTDFLEQESGKPSFMGVERKHADFNSDFFKLVPQFVKLLKVTQECDSIQDGVIELSVLLFKTNEMLSETTRLQRDGYHAAWINHKDLFIEAATDLNKLSSKIIENIESMYDKL